MRKSILSILPIIFIFATLGDALAVGTTTYGLSGTILTYYAYPLGKMENVDLAPQMGIDFWAAPHVTPPLSAEDSHHGHLYLVAPIGFTLSIVNRFEVAAMVTASGINIVDFTTQFTNSKIAYEGGFGDSRISLKGQILKEEKAPFDLAFVGYVDIPTGRTDFTHADATIPDDPLYRRDLSLLTDGDFYNIALMAAVTKQLYPKDDGDFNMLGLHGNFGYVVRTGRKAYADDINLYRFDWNDPNNFDQITDHTLVCNRPDYFLFSGALEFTYWRFLTSIFDSQFRLYQSADSDAVLHPGGLSAKHAQILLGLRFNIKDSFHVTLGFGKTFGKWAIDYTTGSLSNKNYNAHVIVSADIPIISADRDGDGIPDKRDACPDEAEDVDGFQDSDGCPDLDNDGDGIKDAVDGAPNDPEDFDGWNDSDGIPDLDNDNDGIPDARDKCPDEPETFNNYLDDDGCPDEAPEKVTISNIVLFFGDKYEMLLGQQDSLAEAAQILKDYPNITATLGGHSASTGRPDFEMELSVDRAEVVKKYLVDKFGIDASRLIVKGYGSTIPIGDNTTEAGKAQNRRVEFTVNQ